VTSFTFDAVGNRLTKTTGAKAAIAHLKKIDELTHAVAG